MAFTGDLHPSQEHADLPHVSDNHYRKYPGVRQGMSVIFAVGKLYFRGKI